MDRSNPSNPSNTSHWTAGQLCSYNYMIGDGHISSEIGDSEPLADLLYQELPGPIQRGIVNCSDYFQHREESTQEQTPLGLHLTFGLQAATSSNVESSFAQKIPSQIINELPFQAKDRSWNIQSGEPGPFFGSRSGGLYDSPLSSSESSFSSSPELNGFSRPISQTSGYSDTSFNGPVSNQNWIYPPTPPQWPNPQAEAKSAFGRANSWTLGSEKLLGYAITTSAELVSVPASNVVSNPVTAVCASSTRISSWPNTGIPSQEFAHLAFDLEGLDFGDSDSEDVDLEEFDSRDFLRCPEPGCPKKFRRDRRCAQGNLNRHVRHHGGRKAFACEACDKVYRRKDTLQNHERSHPQLRREPPIARRRKSSRDSSNSQ